MARSFRCDTSLCVCAMDSNFGLELLWCLREGCHFKPTGTLSNSSICSKTVFSTIHPELITTGGVENQRLMGTDKFPTIFLGSNPISQLFGDPVHVSMTKTNKWFKILQFSIFCNSAFKFHDIYTTVSV